MRTHGLVLGPEAVAADGQCPCLWGTAAVPGWTRGAELGSHADPVSPSPERQLSKPPLFSLVAGARLSRCRL